jgi:hypothetical protein
MVLSNADVMRECRCAAKLCGLTFKKVGNYYAYFERGTSIRVTSLCSLGFAYELVCSEELNQLRTN